MQPIEGWEGRYSITNDGRIWSHRYLRYVYTKISKRGYVTVRLTKNSKSVYKPLHRLLAIAFLGAREKDFVDHINRIKTDNSLANLRLCSARQNCANVGLKKANTSGFKGVYFNKDAKKWQAYCQQKYIGIFDTAALAAHAYDQRARAAYGNHAWLNFPDTIT